MVTTDTPLPPEGEGDKEPLTPLQLREIMMKLRQGKELSIPSKKVPHRWSYRSNSPYYKKYYGEELKEVFDRLAAGGPPECFFYSVALQNGLSPNSLYLRVNQAILFLIEQLDTPEDYYKKLKRRILVERKEGMGIKLSLRDEGVSEDSKAIKPLTEHQFTKEAPKWKRALLEWCESAGIGDEYDKEGLSLTAPEVKELEAMFNRAPYKDKFIASITSKRVIIFCVPLTEEAG